MINWKKIQLDLISIGQRKGMRQNQQDSIYYKIRNTKRGKQVLLALADGMGGLVHGDEVSALAVNTACEYFQRISEEELNEPSIILMRIIELVNQKVLEYIKENCGENSGTTLILAIKQESKLFFASVGDSRIYLIRKHGILQLNREHNYETDLIRMAGKGQITAKEIKDNFQIHALTSYIGMQRLRLIDFNKNPISLKFGDRIMLISDGVYQTLNDFEIRKAIRFTTTRISVERLLNRVQQENCPTQDNYSVVILKNWSRSEKY